jgi:putative hydrolase of the HAD superfamily
MPKTLMTYRSVVFDLFDTLVNNPSTEQFQQAYRDMGAILCVPSDELQRLWRQSADQRNLGTFATLAANLSHICSELGIEADAEKTAAAAQLRGELERPSFATPREGTLETLIALKEAGYKIGIISNCYPHVPALLRESPIASFVDAAIFSCEVGVKKPDPHIYRLSCERLGVEPQECLFVGDGESDELRGAAEAGMTPVLVKSPLSNPDINRPDIGDWTGPAINNARELLPILGVKAG